MTIKTWLDNASQDADRRGLASLRPLLETLARSTSALRTADWNYDSSGDDDWPYASANAADSPTEPRTRAADLSAEGPAQADGR